MILQVPQATWLFGSQCRIQVAIYMRSQLVALLYEVQDFRSGVAVKAPWGLHFCKMFNQKQQENLQEIIAAELDDASLMSPCQVVSNSAMKH